MHRTLTVLLSLTLASLPILANQPLQTVSPSACPEAGTEEPDSTSSSPVPVFCQVLEEDNPISQGVSPGLSAWGRTINLLSKITSPFVAFFPGG